MKFEDLIEFEHPLVRGVFQRLILFPNGYGLSILGDRSKENDPYDFFHLLGLQKVYGDGVTTFEVAEICHDYYLEEPVQGEDYNKFEVCNDHYSEPLEQQTIEQINKLIKIVEHYAYR